MGSLPKWLGGCYHHAGHQMAQNGIKFLWAGYCAKVDNVTLYCLEKNHRLIAIVIDDERMFKTEYCKLRGGLLRIERVWWGYQDGIQKRRRTV